MITKKEYDKTCDDLLVLNSLQKRANRYEQMSTAWLKKVMLWIGDPKNEENPITALVAKIKSHPAPAYAKKVKKK